MRHDDMDVSPIVVDIETAPLDNAGLFLDPPDLSGIEAPSNYKDEAKIADYIARERERLTLKHERDAADRAALDRYTGRVIALGTWTERDDIRVALAKDETQERHALAEFWRYAAHRTIVGFNILEFDLRFLLTRSWILDAAHPSMELRRHAHGVTDLFDLLTFGEGYRDKGVMRRTLGAFCRRLGIPHDDSIRGDMMPALARDGAWDVIEAHVRDDVRSTVALARRRGVVPQAQPLPLESVL